MSKSAILPSNTQYIGGQQDAAYPIFGQAYLGPHQSDLDETNACSSVRSRSFTLLFMAQSLDQRGHRKTAKIGSALMSSYSARSGPISKIPTRATPLWMLPQLLFSWPSCQTKVRAEKREKPRRKSQNGLGSLQTSVSRPLSVRFGRDQRVQLRKKQVLHFAFHGPVVRPKGAPQNGKNRIGFDIKLLGS